MVKKKPLTKIQMSNLILTIFYSLYEEKTKKISEKDRYRDKWAMLDLLDDFSKEEILSVVEYFFTLNLKSHDIKYFYSNYNNLRKGKLETVRRKEERSRLLAATKKLVEGE
jgi:hypothetical protein